MKTVKAADCSALKMVAGGEKLHPTVIDRGVVKDWVGFAWIALRTPTEEDYKKYPVVVHGDECDR